MDIEKNVALFLTRCSQSMGARRLKAYRHSVSYVLRQCKSPIEQLFYIALTSVMEASFPFMIHREVMIAKNLYVRHGLDVKLQKHFIEEDGRNDYVDFCLTYWGDAVLEDKENSVTCPEAPLRQLIVELDGRDYHRRNLAQMNRENDRDFFLQSSGFPIMHVTGSALYADPFATAIKALAFLTGWDKQSFVHPEVKGWKEIAAQAQS